MLEVTKVRLMPGRESGFDHSFEAGEIAVVLGANGSGKTDLCRLIAGLNTRAEGGISLNGSPIDHLSPRHRPVSLVYQAFVNYPNLSVFENIASPLRARKLSGHRVSEAVSLLAEKLRIGELLERLPQELSGGQQQRVAIARALAKQADVVLLDEPLVNLDFKLREALETELRELLHETNTVVVYTSSDPRDAFNFGDRLLLLSEGRKIQTGSPLEVYRNPCSVAAMELLADPGINRFQRQGELCALRPEHLDVAEAGADSPDRLTFAMRVTAFETNGDESFVHGEVEGRDWVMRSRGMLPAEVGTVLQLSARPRDVVRF